MIKLDGLLHKIQSGDVSYFLDLSYLKNMVKNDKIISAMVETYNIKENQMKHIETKVNEQEENRIKINKYIEIMEGDIINNDVDILDLKEKYKKLIEDYNLINDLLHKTINEQEVKLTYLINKSIEEQESKIKKIKSFNDLEFYKINIKLNFMNDTLELNNKKNNRLIIIMFILIIISKFM